MYRPEYREGGGSPRTPLFFACGGPFNLRFACGGRRAGFALSTALRLLNGPPQGVGEGSRRGGKEEEGEGEERKEGRREGEERRGGREGEGEGERGRRGEEGGKEKEKERRGEVRRGEER